jgi:hypothetical protein
MGADESRETKTMGSSFLLVEESHVQEILFNPINSRAVCAGIGKHLNMRRRTNDIPSCDGDTKLMYEIVSQKLAIPEENVTILNSSRDSTYSATVCNIEDSLRRAADIIGPDGVLLFYFSGHAIRYAGGSKVALVAADFVEDQKQLITAETLARVLGELKERHSELIVIFDCCFAGQVAQDLSSIMGTLGYKVCTIAACSAVENSVCFDRLGAGFFTYFMHDFMSRIKLSSTGTFPAASILKYCTPLCNAMATLVLKRDDVNKLTDASMHPAVYSTELQLNATDDQYMVDPVTEETDAPGDPLSFRKGKTFQLLAYQSPEDFAVDKKWSKKVHVWLQTKAAPSLKVLQKEDFLVRPNVLETVCCLIMRSVALLTAVHRPELALKPNVFILSYFRMIEVFVDIEPSAMKSIDDYMALTVLYYIKGVVECSNKTISELGTLVDLYSALVEDQKSKKETDQDEPDSVRHIN